VSPLAVPESIARFDAWIMLGAAIALAGFARTGWRINRVEGAALLTAYPAYLVTLVA
jgi:cation:H+ antiporter